MENDKYYTCRKDKAFKYLFLNESNKSILKALLEFILKEEITNIELLPTELTNSNIKTKGKQLDALVKTKDKIIGLEMNANETDGFRVKNMGYLTNNYSSHVGVGETYNEDMMIMQINFTYGMMHRKEGKDKKGIREYYMQDKEGKKFVSNIKIIEINMDYFMEIWYSKNQKEIEENKFLIMLDLEEKELKDLSKDPVVIKYMDKLNSLNNDIVFKKLMTEEEEREKYENTIKKNAKQQGITEEKIKISKTMLQKNMSIEDISEITGLSLEEIEKLK